jgi:hypothetical protein
MPQQRRSIAQFPLQLKRAGPPELHFMRNGLFTKSRPAKARNGVQQLQL